MGAAAIGFVGALPVVAQVLQLGGAFLTARFGHRRAALVAVALSRQTFLPLVFLPILPLGPDGRRVLLLAAAAAHHGLGILANNAWNTWMGELIPARVRGRYFGRRTALCTVAGGLSALVAGLVLDRGQRHGLAGPVLQALAFIACAAGALSVVLMARQHSAPDRAEPLRRVGRGLRWPLADPRVRRIATYAVAWNGACGLSVPFFGLYVLSDLRAGYAVFAATGAGYALARIASASAFGRAVDRDGPRRVIIGCTAGLALSPVAWIACGPDRLWPLVVETLVGGLLFGGHSVATFALPLSVGGKRERPFCLAVVAFAGGAAFACTSAVGGFLVGRGYAPLRLLLACAVVLRVVAVLAAIPLPRGRAEQTPLRASPLGPATVEGERRAA
jgi:MFS family permease